MNAVADVAGAPGAGGPGARVPERIRRRRVVVRCVVAALLCVIALVALTAVFVQTRTGQRVDDAALRGQVVEHPRAEARTDRVLRTISVGSLITLGGALVGIALVRGRWNLALGVGAVIAGSNITTQVYKAIVDRPPLIRGEHLIAFNTLPSGHSTVAASLAAALILVVPVRLRPLAATFGALYACGIAAGTLAAGWHRPSDAIAAFAVVGIWVAIVCAVLVAARGTGSPRVSVGLPGLVVGAVLVLGLAFGVITVSTTLNSAEGIHTVRLGLAYMAALGSIVFVGVIFLMSEVLLLRGVSLDAPARDRSRWT